MPVSSIADRIKSIQRGVIAFGDAETQTAATIAAVDTDKAMVSCLGCKAGGTGTNAQLARVELTNATTVTAYRANASANAAQCGYEVIEYE